VSTEQTQPRKWSGERKALPRRKRTRDERRAARAAGVDRFGRQLARVARTNPRALGTNPLAIAQSKAVFEKP
jgi:hypothetical protein